MSPVELLRYVVEVLDRNGIEYMATGSVVSSLQGEPRSTHDLDIVVAIQLEDVHALSQAFARPDFYVDAQAMAEAVRAEGMFNVINIAEGDKVDFWLLTDEPFDRSRFGRRRKESVFGIRLEVSSPEDTILAKLRWSELSGGNRQSYTDALRVFEVQARQLDMSYLNVWAERLDVVELWTRVQKDAELPE